MTDPNPFEPGTAEHLEEERNLAAAGVQVRAVSIADAATLLGVSLSTAHKAVKDGSLPSIRVAGRIVIPKAWLENQLQELL